MSSEQVRKRKIFCKTPIAARSFFALVKGPYSFVPRGRGLRVNSTRGKSSRMRISRYGKVLSSLSSWLKRGCTSLIRRASSNRASTSLWVSMKSTARISGTRLAVRISSAAAELK